MLHAGVVYTVPEARAPILFLTAGSYRIVSIPMLKNLAICRILRLYAIRSRSGSVPLLRYFRISADASAALNLLEKLLAPAIGTKPGFSEGKKTYDQDTLKPEELKECIVVAHRYDDREAHRPFDADEITRTREELKKEGEQIKAAIDAAQKEPVSEEQAKKLNQRSSDYNAKLDEFNLRVNTANLNAKTYNGAQKQDFAAFNDQCAGKRFYKSDLEAVRPTLEFDISGILAGKKSP